MQDADFEVSLAGQPKCMGFPMSANLLFPVESCQSPMEFSGLFSRLGACVGLSSTKNVRYFWLVHVDVWLADLNDWFKSARPGSRWCQSALNEDLLFGLVLLSVPWVGTF